MEDEDPGASRQSSEIPDLCLRGTLQTLSRYEAEKDISAHRGGPLSRADVRSLFLLGPNFLQDWLSLSVPLTPARAGR